MFFFKKKIILGNSKSIPEGSNLNKLLTNIVKLNSRCNLDKVDFIVDLSSNFAPRFEKWLEDLRVIGFIEIRRVIKRKKIHFFLKRQKYVHKLEQLRVELGYWKQSSSAPRYSVCVCNYNMADTLDRAMSSVASQLNPKLYEIVVVDDGSTDNSLDVLAHLSRKYTHFRFIPLSKDSRRKLGETRNLSIRAARGDPMRN